MAQPRKITIFCLALLGLIISSSINAQDILDSEPINVSLTLVKGEPVPQGWKEKFAFPENYFITTQSDFDGDGIYDYLEYYADTNPIDGSSRFKVISTELDGTSLTIKWTSSSNEDPAPRKYIIFRAEAQHLGALVNASSIEEIQDNTNITQIGPLPAANAEETTYTDNEVDTSKSFFYRVFLFQPLPSEQ